MLEEGQRRANAIGDRRAHLYLSMVYGRLHCAAGDVAGYLEAVIENQRSSLEIDDIGVQANAWGYLTDALVWATRLPAGAPEGRGRARTLSPLYPFHRMGHWGQSP